MSPQESPGFFVAAYGLDGNEVGVGFWPTSRLSPEWVDISTAFLQSQGPCFDTALGDPLSHIQIKFTSVPGVAMSTLLAHGHLAASVLLLSGSSAVAEAEVARMFVDSLRQVDAVTTVTDSASPFEGILSLTDRPLMVVVPWPNALVADEDHELVRELSTHLAAAFFTRQ